MELNNFYIFMMGASVGLALVTWGVIFRLSYFKWGKNARNPKGRFWADKDLGYKEGTKGLKVKREMDEK